MHEDVALEFARWLSPAFAIWCNDRIKELLTKGTTSINQLSRKQLALMVIQAEEENEYRHDNVNRTILVSAYSYESLVICMHAAYVSRGF